MNNVDKARYFIKKAAVHSYLRSMLHNIKLEKVAQTQTTTYGGHISGEEYQKHVLDRTNAYMENYRGPNRSRERKMQEMRYAAEYAKNKFGQQNQQGNTAENSTRARPLGGNRNALTTLDDNLAQADRQISEAAQQAQQRIRTVQRPDSTPGQMPQINYPGQQAPAQQAPAQPAQFNQVPQVPNNRPPIRRGNQGGTSWR